MTISYGLCWNIDSRKIIWPSRAHFGSENESLKGLIGVSPNDEENMNKTGNVLTIGFKFLQIAHHKSSS